LPRKAKICKKCGRYAKKGSDYCFAHTSNGGRKPTTYSKAIKKRNIFDLIDEAKKSQNRAKLFDMTEDIAAIQGILDAHKDNVLSSYGNVEMARKRRDESRDEKSDAYKVMKFRPDMDDDEALQHLISVTNAYATNAIERLVEKKAAMIERFYKTERNKAETYTIQQMGVLVSYVSAVIKHEVLDAALRDKIGARLEMVPFDNILKGDIVDAQGFIDAKVIEEAQASPIDVDSIEAEERALGEVV